MPSGTHVGEGAQGAQETDCDEAKDEELPSPGQDLRVLIHHSRDHSLQAPKLQRKCQHEAEKGVVGLVPFLEKTCSPQAPLCP